MIERLPRIHAASMLAMCMLAASCSRGSADNVSDAKGVSAPSAQAYLDGFIKDDPATCFGGAELKSAEMERKGEHGAAGPPPLRRAVVLIDGSGSMNARLDGQSKLDLARQAARTFIDTLPPDVEVSVIAFGQQGDNSPAGKARSCSAIDTLMPMTADHDALTQALNRTRAVGWTPLAKAMATAEAGFAQSSRPGEQVIYVVSDGEETCGGDPVATAHRINQGRTRAIVNIIGFGLPRHEAASLQSVASAGGGSFVNLQTKQAFDQTMAAVREANRQAANAVRASNAISTNAVNTSDAIAKANLCISDMMSSESNRVSDDLAARAARGEHEPSERSVLDLLKARHAELKSRLKAFSDRLTTAEGDARSKIDADANKAKQSR